MELGAGFWFRMCQTEQIGLPRDCSFKEHASTRPDALAKPSSTHSAFYKPPSCHLGGGRLFLQLRTVFLPFPLWISWGAGLQVTIFLGSPLAPGYSVHFLTVTGFDYDLIGSMQNPDCSIIIRQRNYWSIKGCSQLLD